MRWIEKYRPKDFSQCVGNPDIYRQLEGLAKGTLQTSFSKDIPHFFFYGTPGTGKTTAAYILASIIAGDDMDNVTEINASSDRGIEVIKGTVTRAIRNLTLNGGMRVIIMDESEGLTPDAQKAFTRPLEQTGNTVFIFTVNDERKVHDTIRSRCACFHFKPVDARSISDRLKEILKMEGITLEEKEILEVATRAEGDIRRAINELQKVCADKMQDAEIAGMVDEMLATT